MKGSEFVFDGASLFHYKYHKISLSCGRSNTDHPKWLKKVKINPKKKK